MLALIKITEEKLLVVTQTFFNCFTVLILYICETSLLPKSINEKIML